MRVNEDQMKVILRKLDIAEKERQLACSKEVRQI